MRWGVLLVQIVLEMTGDSRCLCHLPIMRTVGSSTLLRLLGLPVSSRLGGLGSLLASSFSDGGRGLLEFCELSFGGRTSFKTAKSKSKLFAPTLRGQSDRDAISLSDSPHHISNFKLFAPKLRGEPDRDVISPSDSPHNMSKAPSGMRIKDRQPDSTHVAWNATFSLPRIPPQTLTHDDKYCPVGKIFTK